ALPLPRGRQAGQDRRFLAPPRPWNCGRTSILSQGARDERSTRPTQSDSRRSCAEPARTVAAAPRASVLAERQGADLQIFEQHRRARSSGDQATLRVDGWVQVVRERGHHDRWHRVGPSHSQGTILVWPRPSAPWLVEEGRMGDGTRVGTGSEKTKGLVATKISLDAPEPPQASQLSWQIDATHDFTGS